MPNIYYYTLEETSLENGKLYHVTKNSKLIIKCNSKLCTQNVRLFCNNPSFNESDCGLLTPPPSPTDEKKFNFIRDKFYEYKWNYPSTSLKNDIFDKFIEICFTNAGSFDFYFVIDENGSNKIDVKYAKGGGIIVVQPELKLSNGEIVDLDTLQIQTVIAKQLGPLNEWESRLRVSKESGYNMLHFTPTEESSKISNSPFSIRDHQKLNLTVSDENKFNYDDLAGLIKKIYKKWNLFSISDVVYNHISTDAPFLVKCPEAAYNLENSPYLKPDFLLDRVFYYLSKAIGDGNYESIGIGANEINIDNLEQIREILKGDLLPEIKLEEFFMMNVDEILKRIREIILNEMKEDLTSKNELSNKNNEDLSSLWSQLKIIRTEPYNRFSCVIDFNIVKNIIKIEFVNEMKKDHKKFDEIVEIVLEKIKNLLLSLNEEQKSEVYSWLDCAVESLISNANGVFFGSENAPKRVSKETPLTPRYFYFPFEDSSVEKEEERIYKVDNSDNKHIMVHNGWVLNQDPMVNFCNPESLVFMKRELFSWTDLVRLRYGDGPESCPKLWEYMADYTRRIASTFHGVRLDNCHNTPLHVAQYLLDIARSINPDLYVMAELFTNSPLTDNIFASKLAINSLIRESKNSANPRELGALVYHFSGRPVGSLYPSKEIKLQESNANAVFFDITHDNKSLISAYTVYDSLSRTALLLMSSCAYGSTRGYDELVPHDINLVEEKRFYAKWKPDSLKEDTDEFLSFDDAIIRAKAKLNKLHYEMGQNGFNEIFVDQLDDEVITVTRHNPESHESIILITRTAFSHSNEACKITEYKVPLKLDKILFEAKLIEKQEDYEFKLHERYINGLKNYKLEFHDDVDLDTEKSFFVSNLEINENESKISFKELTLGAVVVFCFKLDKKTDDTIRTMRNEIKQLRQESDISKTISGLNLSDLNLLLFRCVEEEKTNGEADDQRFTIPNYGSLNFLGFQGFMNILDQLHLSSDLANPLFDNLRAGNWVMDFIINRLKNIAKGCEQSSGLVKLTEWLENVFQMLSKIPRSLIPAYFDQIIVSLHKSLTKRVFEAMLKLNEGSLSSKLIIHGSSFVRLLMMASAQFVGDFEVSKLPNTVLNSDRNKKILSIAAGLPNYCGGETRNWGRDTFISLKGLLLLTNRYEDAKYLILIYGSYLKYGLIPELLGDGKTPRYSSRDAVWWWLKAIKDYTDIVPDGYKILYEEVYRIFPSDGSSFPSQIEDSPKQKLFDIIQEALVKHVNGTKFEVNTENEEFEDYIDVDLNTGFLIGSNSSCFSTWMNKCLYSDDGKLKPVTPRDGSPIELIGLCRCVLGWLIELHKNNHFPYDGVLLDQIKAKCNDLKYYTWQNWVSKIDENFEKYFWIKNSDESEYINKREIYKDIVNSSIPWAEYQLRPNFLIAISLAPQMIDKEHAVKSLKVCREYLIKENNALGIKTLDPTDYNYCGTYDETNESEDIKIAHGNNLHNGPEWLWLMGFYFKSLLIYFPRDDAIKLIQGHLGAYYEHLMSSEWKNLPQFTNENSNSCPFSCPSQAISVANVLEIFHEITNF